MRLPAVIAALIVVSLCRGAEALERHAPPYLRTSRAPRGAVWLFKGAGLDAWRARSGGGPAKWTVQSDEMSVAPGAGDIVTAQQFGSFRLHVEYCVPSMPDRHSQARANSGVYLHGLYEIQVLDSYNNETYDMGQCGAIYGQKAPDINACRPAGEWQTYDIWFTAPQFDATGRQARNPRVTAYHNGVLIHDDVEVKGGPTTASLGGTPSSTGPLMLQDHGAPVRYRNVWIVPQRR